MNLKFEKRIVSKIKNSNVFYKGKKGGQYKGQPSLASSSTLNFNSYQISSEREAYQLTKNYLKPLLRSSFHWNFRGPNQNYNGIFCKLISST